MISLLHPPLPPVPGKPPSALGPLVTSALSWPRASCEGPCQEMSLLPFSLGVTWLLSHQSSPVELGRLCNRTEEVLGGWGRGWRTASAASRKRVHTCAQHTEASRTGNGSLSSPHPSQSICASTA